MDVTLCHKTPEYVPSPQCRVTECCPSPQKFTATKSDYFLRSGSFICIMQKVYSRSKEMEVKTLLLGK
jgi:hypothetical protein